jgi:hypothetical protein
LLCLRELPWSLGLSRPLVLTGAGELPRPLELPRPWILAGPLKLPRCLILAGRHAGIPAGLGRWWHLRRRERAELR